MVKFSICFGRKRSDEFLARVREGGESFAIPRYVGGFWRGRGAGARERARTIFLRPRHGARERGTEGDGRFASVGEESRIYFTAACGEKSKQSVLMQQHRPHLLAWSPCNG